MEINMETERKLQEFFERETERIKNMGKDDCIDATLEYPFHIPDADEITIIHWNYVLDGCVLVIIYEKEDDHERHIQFLRPTPELDEYLMNLHQTKARISKLNELGANWVDEEGANESASEVPTEINETITRYCAQNGISVVELIHSLSCFLSNPRNRDAKMESMASAIADCAAMRSAIKASANAGKNKLMKIGHDGKKL